MRSSTLLLAVLGVSLAACGTFDPEAAVTIDQGVYGLTIAGCDTGNCSDSPAEDSPVSVEPAGGGAPITTKSDGDGFFEVALAPGDYRVCVYSCTPITITDGVRIRRDFVSGPGGGIWCIDGVCRPGE